MNDTQLTKKVKILQFDVSCENLTDYNRNEDDSNGNTTGQYIICAWQKSAPDQPWMYLSKSDFVRCKGDWNPTFLKRFQCAYTNKHQLLRLNIYNVRGAQMRDEDLIGSVTVRLKLIHDKDSTRTPPFKFLMLFSHRFP